MLLEPLFSAVEVSELSMEFKKVAWNKKEVLAFWLCKLEMKILEIDIKNWARVKANPFSPCCFAVSWKFNTKMSLCDTLSVRPKKLLFEYSV